MDGHIAHKKIQITMAKQCMKNKQQQMLYWGILSLFKELHQ